MKKATKESCRLCFEDEMWSWGPPSRGIEVMMNLSGCLCVRRGGMELSLPVDKDTVTGDPMILEIGELDQEQREDIKNFPKLCTVIDNSQQKDVSCLDNLKAKIIITNPVRSLLVLKDGETVGRWSLPADGPGILAEKARSRIEKYFREGLLNEPT